MSVVFDEANNCFSRPAQRLPPKPDEVFKATQNVIVNSVLGRSIWRRTTAGDASRSCSRCRSTSSAARRATASACSRYPHFSLAVNFVDTLFFLFVGLFEWIRTARADWRVGSCVVRRQGRSATGSCASICLAVTTNEYVDLVVVVHCDAGRGAEQQQRQRQSATTAAEQRQHATNVTTRNRPGCCVAMTNFSNAAQQRCREGATTVSCIASAQRSVRSSA
jgi:hypothetical protein